MTAPDSVSSIGVEELHVPLPYHNNFIIAPGRQILSIWRKSNAKDHACPFSLVKELYLIPVWVLSVHKSFGSSSDSSRTGS